MMSYGCRRLLKSAPFLSRSFWSSDSGAKKMNVREVIEDLTQVSIEVRQEVTSVTDPREKEKIALRHIKKYAAKDAYVNEFQKGLEWFNVSQSISMHQDLNGKICVLDFFTYCCINCMHILPDLAALEKEFSIKDGLVVIGVHSAKFANEKDSSKILAAVQRYNIAHPVVNDAKLSMWRDIGIVCWPSLVILGPKGQPLFALVGEGHREEMFLYVKVALAYFKSLNEISDHSLPIKPSQHLLPVSKDTLLFPGKIHLANIKNEDRIIIADTGNNRILIMDLKGKVEHVVGGYAPAFQDGNFQTARFNAPQGICSLGEEIFVADTENHAIRKIDLVSQTVTTLAGTGEQSHDYGGGNIGKDQRLSSPWDVAIHHHKQGDKTVPILMIAIAGTHQIWGLFLEDTIWWKKKSVKAGTCMAIVGSGREENRNNSYPHAAGLAQPSGLALAREKNMLFFADSESSSVRVVHLDDGKVSGVCGGDRNPGNLHDFGDIDGRQCTAKLQHPLGLAWDSVDSIVYIADTYNHKIKKVDLLGNCTTLYGAGKPTANHKFDEPSGLAVHSGSKIIYVADTNNHRIVSINLEDNKIDTISVVLPSEKMHPDRTYKFDAELSPNGGNLEIALDVKFTNDLKLNIDAPQRWAVNLPEKWTTEASKEAVDKRLQDLENSFQAGISEINQNLGILLGSSSSRLQSHGEAGRLDVDPKQAEFDRINNTINEIFSPEAASQVVSGNGSVSETQHATCQITTEELVASAQATVTRVLTGACTAEAVDKRLQDLETLFQIGIGEINQKLDILLGSSSSRLQSHGEAGRLDVDPRQAEVDRINNTINDIFSPEGTIRAFTHFLRIEHFADKMSQWGSRGYLRSPTIQVGPAGYAMYLKVTPRDVQGDKVVVSVAVGLTRGAYDASLTWPFALKYRVEILDHSEGGYRQDLIGATFDPLNYRHYADLWKRPIGILGNDDNIALVNVRIPANIFLDGVNERSDYFSRSRASNRKYLWQGSLLIKLTVYL